jgi:exodeoxyribonuclease VII small subunit
MILGESMAKTKAAEADKTGQSLEEKLERLEILRENIRKPDISLDQAQKKIEEGIKIEKKKKKELEKIENRIEILMNGTDAKTGSPELELFDS